MALLEQWRRQRPWLGLGIAGLGGTLAAPFTAILPWMFTPSVAGTISHRPIEFEEHPLRKRILQILRDEPGLCYRELQKKLSAANGTLRHHLDVLVSGRKITIVPVNGRSCHYPGPPSNLEELQHLGLNDQEKAAEMLPHGLSLAQRLVVDQLMLDEPPSHQAELARQIGRSRATVHSAVQVLRRRGILHAERLELAPHLLGRIKPRKLDYDWVEER